MTPANGAWRTGARGGDVARMIGGWNPSCVAPKGTEAMKTPESTTGRLLPMKRLSTIALVLMIPCSPSACCSIDGDGVSELAGTWFLQQGTKTIQSADSRIELPFLPEDSNSMTIRDDGSFDLGRTMLSMEPGELSSLRSTGDECAVELPDGGQATCRIVEDCYQRRRSRMVVEWCSPRGRAQFEFEAELQSENEARYREVHLHDGNRIEISATAVRGRHDVGLGGSPRSPTPSPVGQVPSALDANAGMTPANGAWRTRPGAVTLPG